MNPYIPEAPLRSYSFGDARLLQLGLRHSSAGSSNFSQLAWLGTQVWGLLASTDSFRRSPDASRKGVRSSLRNQFTFLCERAVTAFKKDSCRKCVGGARVAPLQSDLLRMYCRSLFSTKCRDPPKRVIHARLSSIPSLSTRTGTSQVVFRGSKLEIRALHFRWLMECWLLSQI